MPRSRTPYPIAVQFIDFVFPAAFAGRFEALEAVRGSSAALGDAICDQSGVRPGNEWSPRRKSAPETLIEAATSNADRSSTEIARAVLSQQFRTFSPHHGDGGERLHLRDDTRPAG